MIDHQSLTNDTVYNKSNPNKIDLKEIGNAWFIPYETIQYKSERGDHSTIFPIKLPEMCIKLLENLRKYVMKIRWKKLILIWDNASFHISRMVNDYVKAQKDWLTIVHLPKKAPYLNPNERKVNETQ